MEVKEAEKIVTENSKGTKCVIVGTLVTGCARAISQDGKYVVEVEPSDTLFNLV